MTNLQNRPIIVNAPVEIEFACNEIRKQLATISWLTQPYFIAQRFFREDATTKQKFVYPETYAPSDGVTALNVEDQKKYPYQRLTPDRDNQGMSFFMVGKGIVDYANNEQNFITYPVSIIFSVNLELIDKAKLLKGLFTQDLMKEVRRLLTTSATLFAFRYKILSETRDLQETYTEFRLDEIEQYNRAPMQCFRFDLEVTIEEDCT